MAGDGAEWIIGPRLSRTWRRLLRGQDV